MPRVNDLSPDAQIKDGDKLIGIDSENTRGTVTFEVGDLKDYFNDTTLADFRDGRILAAYDQKFIETPLYGTITSEVLVGEGVDDGTTEATAALASSSTVISIGADITNVVFQNAFGIEDGDLIIIENQDTGERGFGVVLSADSENSQINLQTGAGLNLGDDYINFIASEGYNNKLIIYRTASFISDKDFRINGSLTITGGVVDEHGETLIPANPVTLNADNTFTADNTFETNTVFETSLTVGDGGVDTFIFESPSAVPSNDNILAIDTSDNIMKFKSVGELLVFSDTDENTIATWAEGNSSADVPDDKISASSVNQHVESWAQDGNTDDIPDSKIPIATSTTIGGVMAGSNVTIGANGAISTSNDTGTLDLSDGTTDVDNATKLIFSGTAITGVSASGTEATVTINSGATTFGSAAGNVATWAEGNNTDTIPATKLPGITFGSASGNVSTWAEGDDTSEIPATKLTALEDRANTWTENNTFENRLRIGDSVTYDLPAVTTAPTAGQVLTYPSSGSELTFTTIPSISGNNAFSGANSFTNATGPDLTLQRVDTTPVNNDTVGAISYQAYSTETSSYQDFVTTEGRYLSNSTYDYGQFRVNTNFAADGGGAFSTLTAFTIDRTGATTNVDATFNEDVTIGSSSTDTLTVNATASFEETITGAVTQVLNDRDSSTKLNIWYGTEAQYTAIGAGNYDSGTIYITT